MFRPILPIIGRRRDGRPIYLVAGGAQDGAPFSLPDDLTGLPDTDLASLREQAVAAFDAIYAAEGGPQVSDLARAADLANAIDALNGETERRSQAAAEFDTLRSRVHRPAAQPAEPDPEPAGDPDSGDDSGARPEPPGEPVVAAGQHREPARTAPRDTGGLNPQRGHLNASLRQAQNLAPDPQVPDATSEMVITAAAATAGAPIGHRFGDLTSLAKAMTSYARGMPISRGNPSYVPFATVERRWPDVLGDHTDPKVVKSTIERLTDPGVLVAAGGWCAPPVPRYDFFNIACQARTGLVDLPSISIDRGSISFPTSPSLADVLSNPAAFAPFGATFNASSMPWLWTEADDILTVTGTGTKPCIRVPCPGYNTATLECYGHCITAGNLASAAFPENVANFISLVMAAQLRAENFRYLAQMVSLSTAASSISCTGTGTAAPVLGAVELAATDYRTKYGMCDDDVLEVVIPTWIKGAIRSDLAKRTGVDMINVTDAMIADWFDTRGVRAQMVGEYQVRTAGFPGQAAAITSWPSTVEFMVYAAGTFVRGDGMTLDLGVVRDSTLNAENDHTAAWAEECHLIARLGHESRRYSVPICTDGTTGAADQTACCV
jgi:hypothetical protein